MSLSKGVVRIGGLCSIKYCKWEDVAKFPIISPVTGKIETSIELKPGKFLYYCKAIDQSQSYEEKQNKSNAGPFVEMMVKGNLHGSSVGNTLTIQQMVLHQWVILVEDRDGATRLIGNQDTGADFVNNYSSGTVSDSRKTDLSWKWENPLSAPVYNANSFDIIIGGILITAGSLQLLLQFEVGATGAPMDDGDTILINSLFENKNLLILADGIGIPVDDLSGAIDWTGSIQRHAKKAPASNTIEFIGGVVNEEKIQIYAYS